MKKIIRIIVMTAVLLAVMYAEYRYIMVNQKPYYDENGTLYIEVFDQVDTYYAAPISEME